MNRARRIGIIALSLAVAGVLTTLHYSYSERYPGTDDAYVDADVVGIVAQARGPIVNLAVEHDWDLEKDLKTGFLLFLIL